MTIHFIRAIDVQRQWSGGVQIQHRNLAGLQALSSRLGTRHGALNSVLDTRQGVNKIVDCRARANAETVSSSTYFRAASAARFFISSLDMAVLSS
jgi:hypothetical protein